MHSQHHPHPIARGPEGPVFKKYLHGPSSSFAKDVDFGGQIDLEMEWNDIELEPTCYSIMDDDKRS